MADPIPGVELPDFAKMDPLAILDCDPATWTSGEATLIWSIALAYFADAYLEDPENRLLFAFATTVAQKAVPQIDLRIQLKWPKVVEHLRKVVPLYGIHSEEDNEEDSGKEEGQARPASEGDTPDGL